MKEVCAERGEAPHTGEASGVNCWGRGGDGSGWLMMVLVYGVGLGSYKTPNTRLQVV